MNDRHLQKPYPLRMPDEMRGKLEEAAERGGRSLHAEILRRLEVGLSSENGLEGTGSDQSALVTTIARLNADLARGELDKYTLEARAAALALDLLTAAGILQSLKSKDPAVEEFAQKFIEHARPFAEAAKRLETEFDVRVKALSDALTEVRRSLEPHNNSGDTLDLEAFTRRMHGLPFASKDVSADIMAQIEDGSVVLVQAKTARPDKHDLPAEGAGPARRKIGSRAKEYSENAPNTSKKSTKS